MKDKGMKYDLEDRLVNFAVLILDLAEKMPESYSAIHLSRQIASSGTSPALLYGEAQGAESQADFIHKMNIGLKELRETYICLKIIFKKKYMKVEEIKTVANENNELISIFVKSVETAKKRLNKN